MSTQIEPGNLLVSLCMLLVDAVGVDGAKALVRTKLEDDRFWKAIELVCRRKDEYLEGFVDKLDRDMAVDDLWKNTGGQSS